MWLVSKSLRPYWERSWGFLDCVFQEILRDLRSRVAHRHSLYFRPRLEALEERYVLDTMEFNGTQGVLWSIADNWDDLENPNDPPCAELP